RAAGFSPAVVRALAAATIDARQAPRRRALAEPVRDAPLAQAQVFDASTTDAWRAEEFARLDRDRARQLRAALDDEPPAQRAAADIDDDYADLAGAVTANCGGVMLPEDREVLALLAREHAADLAQVAADAPAPVAPQAERVDLNALASPAGDSPESALRSTRSTWDHESLATALAAAGFPPALIRAALRAEFPEAVADDGGEPDPVATERERFVRAATDPETRELRTSPLAAQLREQLAGFAATDDEFRLLYRLERDHPGGATDDQLRATLGDARFAAYRRATDPDHQFAVRLAARLGLPAEMVQRSE